jgi:MoxR-like ATPase
MTGTQTAQTLLHGASQILHGKQDFLELLIAGILARGHILIEDNPGLGKTTIAKTLARLITDDSRTSLNFKRIQCTPDLLPYDITGVDVFDPETRSFHFVPGPVFAHIVLADEINRSTPKVQSALLEVMAERQVTVGQNTHKPPDIFFVLATENPIESEGTFPLPAAQLDRFMMRLSLGYPDREAELQILSKNPSETLLLTLEPVISIADFVAAQNEASTVFCHPSLQETLVDIIRDTRIHRSFSLGASPRASLFLLAACRTLAMIRGRSFVSDEDLVTLAVPVLAHRLIMRDPHQDKEKTIKEICYARTETLALNRFQNLSSAQHP